MKDEATYVKTYFRIDAGYVWGHGINREQLARFEEEIKGLLTSIGFDRWERKHQSSSLTCWRGAEDLYCHPMDLTGYVKAEAIPEIKAVLEQGQSFRLRTIDTYELCRNYTPEEFREALAGHREETERQILDSLTVKKRRHYRDFGGIPLSEIGLGIIDRIENCLRQTWGDFQQELLQDVVTAGKVAIMEKNGRVYYRTVTKNVKQQRKDDKSPDTENLEIIQYTT